MTWVTEDENNDVIKKHGLFHFCKLSSLSSFSVFLFQTEMEVDYFPEGGSITDYVCEMFDSKVGVSVTRAMKFGGGVFTEEDAEHLLNKKLKGKGPDCRF